MHLTAAGDDVIDNRLTEALGRISIKESHLRAILLLQKAVERC